MTEAARLRTSSRVTYLFRDGRACGLSLSRRYDIGLSQFQSVSALFLRDGVTPGVFAGLAIEIASFCNAILTPVSCFPFSRQPIAWLRSSIERR